MKVYKSYAEIQHGCQGFLAEYLKQFLSESTQPIEPIFLHEYSLEGPLQKFSNRKNNMATTAELSLTLDTMGI